MCVFVLADVVRGSAKNAEWFSVSGRIALKLQRWIRYLGRHPEVEGLDPTIFPKC